jgi:hypothetical protein
MRRLSTPSTSALRVLQRAQFAGGPPQEPSSCALVATAIESVVFDLVAVPMSILFDSEFDEHARMTTMRARSSSRNRCSVRCGRFSTSSIENVFEHSIGAQRAFHGAEKVRGTTRTC